MNVTVCVGLYVFFFFFYQVASSLGVSLFWQPATCYINFVFIQFIILNVALIKFSLSLSLSLTPQIRRVSPDIARFIN